MREELELTIIKLIYPQYAPILDNLRTFFLSKGLNSTFNAVFILFVLGIFLIYFLAIWKEKKTSTIIIFAVLFQLICFFSYPIFSTDIYDYVLNSKVTVEYKQNVWTTPPMQVVRKDDIFYTFGRWKDKPSPYGITHHYFYDFVNQNSPRDFLTLLINFKLVGLIFGLITIPLVYKILKDYYPENLNMGLVTLFWNPLFVWDVASSSHDNIIMIFFMLLGFLFYKKKSYIISGLALGFATQMKYVPVILAIFIGLYLLRLKKIRELLLFGIPFALVNLFGLWVMGDGAINYLTAVSTGSSYYWQSFHFLVHQVYPGEKMFFTLVFFIFFAIQAFRGLQKKADPIRLFVETLLFYLLFITSFYWNWYVLWILPFVLFLPWDKLTKAVIIFTLTSSLAHPVYWLLLRFVPNELYTHVIIYLLLAGPPVIYYLTNGRIFKKTQN